MSKKEFVINTLIKHGFILDNFIDNDFYFSRRNEKNRIMELATITENEIGLSFRNEFLSIPLDNIGFGSANNIAFFMDLESGKVWFIGHGLTI